MSLPLPDLITAALFAWHDVPRQRALVAALYACLTRVALYNNNTPPMVDTMPLVAVQRTPPVVAHPIHALDMLAADLAMPPHQDKELLVAGARAAFMVLFLIDARVRCLVMAPHAGHAVMRTRPPDRAVTLAWLGGSGRIDPAQSTAVRVALSYMEDCHALAASYNDSLFIDMEDDSVVAANIAKRAQLRTMTHDFVGFMRHWWLLGRHSLEPRLPLELPPLEPCHREAAAADELRRSGAVERAAKRARHE